MNKYREEFEKENGYHWMNSQGEPDIDYVDYLEHKLYRVEKLKKELIELLNESVHFLNHQGDLSTMPTDKWTYKEWMILRFQLNEKLKQIELK